MGKRRLIIIVLMSLFVSVNSSTLIAKVNSQENSDNENYLGAKYPENEIVQYPILGENEDVRETALRYISQKHGIPRESLEVVKEGWANYPFTGRRIWSAWIMDKRYRTDPGFCKYVDLVHIDETGNFVNIDNIEAQEREEYLIKYGKFEPELHKLLQGMGADDRVRVWIWLTPIDHDEIIKNVMARYPEAEGKVVNGRPIVINGKAGEDSIRLADKISEEILQDEKRALKLKGKLVIDFIRAQGFDTSYASEYAPIIFAELPKWMLTKVAEGSDVQAVYLQRSNYQPELDSAAPTVKADVVWERGITGNFLGNIAVVERGRIEFGNIYLENGLSYNPDWPVEDHTTSVAGIIASTHSNYKGIAHGAPPLLSANSGDFSDENIINATEWALNQGARILNNSWGEDTNLQMDAMDMYLDHLVYHHARTVIKSAGNNGDNWVTRTGNVTSPGLAYNVLTVGAIDDKDNPLWSDDTMAVYSSYKDPISPYGDREKPEVVAVGSGFSYPYPNLPTGTNTLSTSPPWTRDAGGGTSFAAPIVAAEAALLMERRDSLRSWPESVKAIIMASATHNIEGSSRLSDRDGAGAVNLSAADDIAASDQWDGSYLFENSPKDYQFTAFAGQKVKAVLCWNSHPEVAHPPSTDELESDLDLWVYDPQFNFVTKSDSFDNPYEIVEFVAPVGGTYTARVVPIIPTTWEWIGFAYYLGPLENFKIIYPSGDAFVDLRDNPDGNYGSEQWFGVNEATDSGPWPSGLGEGTFLKFDLSDIPTGAIITSVNFHAYTYQIWWENSCASHLRAFGTNWDEHTITGNNAPWGTLEDAISDNVQIKSIPSWVVYRVDSAHVKEKLGGEVGFYLSYPGTAWTKHHGQYYRSKEYTDATYHPYLVVTYIMGSGTVRLNPIADAFTDLRDDPGRNYGSEMWIGVNRAGGGKSPLGYEVPEGTFLKFDLSNIPADATIIKATFGAHAYQIWYSTTCDAALREFGTYWDEYTITGNNAPWATLGDTVSSTVRGSVPGWWTHDVDTSYVQQKLGGQIGFYYCYPGTAGGTHYGQYYRSKEYTDATYHPYLEIVYTIGETVNIYPSDDAFVDSQDNPGGNYGSETWIAVNLAGANKPESTWLKFDLSSIPSSATVTSAVFKAYAYQIWWGDRRSAALWDVATNNWSESTITANNAPWGNRGSKISSDILGSVPGWWEWDVTSWANTHKGTIRSAWLSNAWSVGYTHYGQLYYSKEYANAAYRPYLDVTYS
ncbi:MAG: DNRLRE domain-containing protein [Hadesarchaea archaeon]|nr:DNRLRE domain-containing protein [Hadesarchaea archaeon]